jgi:tetratricopeptide (TPR) repeat protein
MDPYTLGILISLVLAGSIYAIYGGIMQLIFVKRMKELEVAMVRYPNYADVRAQLASLHYRYGHFKQAKIYYYEALKIYKYYHYARLKLALICLDLKEMDEAMHHLRKIRIDCGQDQTMLDLIAKMTKEHNIHETYLEDPKEEHTDLHFKTLLHNK